MGLTLSSWIYSLDAANAPPDDDGKAEGKDPSVEEKDPSVEEKDPSAEEKRTKGAGLFSWRSGRHKIWYLQDPNLISSSCTREYYENESDVREKVERMAEERASKEDIKTYMESQKRYTFGVSYAGQQLVKEFATSEERRAFKREFKDWVGDAFPIHL